MVGTLQYGFCEILQKVNDKTDYKELLKLKVQMQTKVTSDTDLNSKLRDITRNMQHPLDDTKLDFLMETFQGINQRCWNPQNIAIVAQIFGSSHAKCPVVVKTLMNVHGIRCDDDIFFEVVISACLGCIRCFDDIHIHDILKKNGSEMQTLMEMCRLTGSKWDATANGCFASYLPKQLTRNRCAQLGWCKTQTVNIIKKTTNFKTCFLIGRL